MAFHHLHCKNCGSIPTPSQRRRGLAFCEARSLAVWRRGCCTPQCAQPRTPRARGETQMRYGGVAPPEQSLRLWCGQARFVSVFFDNRKMRARTFNLRTDHRRKPTDKCAVTVLHVQQSDELYSEDRQGGDSKYAKHAVTADAVHCPMRNHPGDSSQSAKITHFPELERHVPFARWLRVSKSSQNLPRTSARRLCSTFRHCEINDDCFETHAAQLESS